MAQNVDLIGGIAELESFVPLGLGQLALHFVRGSNSLCGLRVATPSGLERRPSQDEPISFQQSRAQRQAIVGVPVPLVEVSIELEGIIEAARRDSLPDKFPRRFRFVRRGDAGDRSGWSPIPLLSRATPTSISPNH